MGNVEIPNWLEALPLAPEFRPTDTEFADPIAYISKIEKECNPFGICKIIPPLPKPSKKYVFNNLNKSLLKCPELGSSSRLGSSDVNGDGEARAVFTTRQQELGQSAKKSKASVVQNSSLGGAHKQVWQSGEIYTLEQFEAKSKVFSKTQLGTIKDITPLVIEAMFWRAASEKPIYLEYANDVPGSGFGEPEGQIRYFHRRRRKRNFFTRTGEDDFHKNESETCLDNESKATTSSQKKSHQSSYCYDKEGTAGWKISNSPWNLQVISRSPGSLTRFMPDDIPGVTSPMVYIGMLFSWFAWHVEDHELHSMNFLHTGSSKTWYSIAGDNAFAFEEVVRTEAYGTNMDRIAALALLGQKTTVMSPEVVVASGIPCCRLVQNPGEFVVTFPRAYHIGFSHGFNCGEAANFGTPQWLNVAKEAAVRRAAMNYLPMLSHQQLLYLLTMSFVSRVPMSLLPGVRSSRLRDRQKEEREILVKKAFIEDILHENNTVSVLLGKDSGYRAILWNQDLLTCPNKDTINPSEGAIVDAISTEKPSHSSPKNHSNEHSQLLEVMSLYMENLNDLYLGSDDLSCDFQVDSGTLACVACGILGFPFMSVVQPSEKASLELVREFPGTSGYLKPCSASNSVSVPENPSTVSNSLSEVNLPPPSITESRNGWNIHNKFLRPRSFCLEHAVEIVELLQCKGGANVLVICHSDFQKIKAHATSIAEEVGNPFWYNEVPLDIASKEDLSMIDLAIEDGVHKESGEDWTSKLGINLRHCVKIRKNSASKQVQHALTLGGLFSNKSQASNFPVIGWKLRRSRSRKIYLPSPDSKPHETTESKNSDALVGMSSLPAKKEVKLIQYSRRNPKTKRGCSSGICKINGSTVALSNCELSKVAPESKTQNVGSSTSVEFSPSIQTPKETNEEGLEVSIRSVENCASEEMNTVREALCSEDLADSVIEPDGADELSEKHSASLLAHSNEKSIAIREEKLAVDQFDGVNEACNLASEENSKFPSDENALVRSCSYPGNEQTSSDQVLDLVSVDEKLGSCITSHTIVSVKEFSEGQHKTSSAEESSNVKPPELNEPIVINEPHPVSTEVSSQILDKEPLHSVRTLAENAEECSSFQRENSHREPSLSELTSADWSLTKYHSIPYEAKESDKDHSGDGNLTFEGSLETTKISFDRKHEIIKSNAPGLSPNPTKGRKRSRELELLTGNKSVCNSFIRSPCEGLRPRVADIQQEVIEKPGNKIKRPPRNNIDNINTKKKKKKEEEKEKPSMAHKCDIESCGMSFDTRSELSLHKQNRCPREGCRKRFRSHKYAMVHERVHIEERPLKCPWKGCPVSFKWSWARTEHMRVHTGERPYKCKVEGCALSFRFVSDFSRHRRKTGHSVS